MPIIRLEIPPGRTPEQKRSFASEVTRIAVETLNCKPESLDILIIEVPKEHWAKAGQFMSER